MKGIEGRRVFCLDSVTYVPVRGSPETVGRRVWRREGGTRRERESGRLRGALHGRDGGRREDEASTVPDTGRGLSGCT